MFSKSYQLLPQRDPTAPRTPGLFMDSDSFSQRRYDKGLSFDYIPKASENDFTGRQLTNTGCRLLFGRDEILDTPNLSNINLKNNKVCGFIIQPQSLI